ncbi:Transient receptor potential-gamma protein [Halotydeus destructor]|nr:Transient receptor potential-gamma protein [Halotydeus destructor]
MADDSGDALVTSSSTGLDDVTPFGPLRPRNLSGVPWPLPGDRVGHLAPVSPLSQPESPPSTMPANSPRGPAHRGQSQPSHQWKPLSLVEKKFLIAVERGDLGSVRRFLQDAKGGHFNMNCCDPIGRSALLMAIDNENLEMIELMMLFDCEMRDALLHAINEEFVEAVELLLDHEETIHVPGTPHSWEAVERETFTKDVTPLILASHKNNYEIIKLLLDRGVSPIPSPHDARCGCKGCREARTVDCLRHSRSRINAYRALASPSLIALSSKDPILTAFELSWQLRRLSFLEPEFKTEYLELRKQCQSFATALLDHTRTTLELEILLNHDPATDSLEAHGKMTLSRLKLAIRCKQKKFCAHANVQQLLASIWYEGLPGFRRKNIVVQTLQILCIGFLFPVLSLAYILAPCTKFGQVMKKPFIKFICHSASYMTFLGLIWSEIKQLWELGLADYLSDMWNILDFITNSLYVATISLRVIAYLQVQKEINMNTGTANLPRESWDAFDPILLAEGLFAAANIFSSLKLVYIFSVNPHLGPLQISLGRMVIDIIKFFSVYTLVCFAFACGMNQLLWYYAEMEKSVCLSGTRVGNGLYANHSQISGPIISIGPNRTYMQKSPNEACLTYRKFSNLFESLQTLFWATFGLIDLENFELTGIQSYTRFWGLTMFGCYCIINVTVLLNLLIAMMNHSYQIISEQADTEWKFARTKLWMSYFEDGGTVPIPFNIIPTPKSLAYFSSWICKKFFSRTKFAKNEAMKTVRRKQRQASERDHRYQSVMRSLVRRYITNEQRTAERQRGVTEDDCNEIKQDISALRFELIEMLRARNDFGHEGPDGLYVDHAKGKARGGAAGPKGPLTTCSMGKRGRKRERRLMKGFDFNLLFMDPATSFDDDLEADSHRSDHGTNKVKSPTRSKFVRLARGLAGKRGSRGNKWKQLIEATRSKVIPFSRSSESVNSLGRSRTHNVSTNDESLSPDSRYDANAKRSLFARKVTSLLQEENQSIEHESDINEERPTTKDGVTIVSLPVPSRDTLSQASPTRPTSRSPSSAGHPVTSGAFSPTKNATTETRISSVIGLTNSHSRNEWI